MLFQKNSTSTQKKKTIRKKSGTDCLESCKGGSEAATKKSCSQVSTRRDADSFKKFYVAYELTFQGQNL